MSIDEFYGEDREGLAYNVNNDGTVKVNDNQLTFDDATVMDEDDALNDDLLN